MSRAQPQLEPTIVAIPPSPGSGSGGGTGGEVDSGAADVHAVAAVAPLEDTSGDAAFAAALANETVVSAALATPTTTSSAPIAPTTAPSAAAEQPPPPNYAVATCSSPWQYDALHPACYQCATPFHPAFNRRHHCRLCGQVFCHACTAAKALIPPSRIVLHPVGGKKAKPRLGNGGIGGNGLAGSAAEAAGAAEYASFTPDPDPDRMLTYIAAASSSSAGHGDDIDETGSYSNNNINNAEQLLYGKGLEERFQLAREPLRVCRVCAAQLSPLQDELRRHNSHAMRYNHVDPTDACRLFNSPVAHTLGHEIRKAAYTLNNLLPQPRRRAGAFVDASYNSNSSFGHGGGVNMYHAEMEQCKDTCSSISSNLGDLDGVRIPAKLLEQAKGVAVMTVVKGGFGLAGVEFGTGLVVARLPALDDDDDAAHRSQFRWSSPSAIGTAGFSWGALIGAQVSDHVFLLMSDAAVAMLYSNTASVQLGADVGIAVGPVGRSVEGDWGVDGQSAAPIYTYSMSKGLYAGISLDGKVIVTRPGVNEKFYGFAVSAQEILAGAVPTPPAAQPLYDALQRCHVYASAASSAASRHHAALPTTAAAAAPLPVPLEALYAQEYGEVPAGAVLSSPFRQGVSDQSEGALSDVTADF